MGPKPRRSHYSLEEEERCNAAGAVGFSRRES